MADPLSAPSPAKINLVLEVLGRREDGFHDLDTVLQTLEISGRVTVGFDSGSGVTVTGAHAAGVPADETNLAWRAADHLAASLRRSTDNLHISLEKRVPAAGGLGGGASDAATALRLLQGTWNAPDAALLEAANAVGSDEAFFLVGGTGRATDRGDRVTPLVDLPPHDVVLILPNLPQVERKTARAFAAVAQTPYDTGGIAEAFAVRPPDSFAGADVHNAFERVAFDLFPGLAETWQAAEAALAEPVRLAGAGPALFWIGAAGTGPDVAVKLATAGLSTSAEIIATRTARSLWRR